MDTVPEPTPSGQSEPRDAFMWLMHCADEFAARGTPWDLWMADHIDQLARNMAFTQSITLEDMVDRLEVLERGKIEAAVNLARAREYSNDACNMMGGGW